MDVGCTFVVGFEVVIAFGVVVGCALLAGSLMIIAFGLVVMV